MIAMEHLPPSNRQSVLWHNNELDIILDSWQNAEFMTKIIFIG